MSNLLRRILCRVAGHRRKGRFKFLEDGQWRSKCMRCGRDLVRGSYGWSAS